jgi:PilZ domain-containing protein
MENGAERRIARRFSMTLPVKVRFADGASMIEMSGETRDVSYRGLYFTIDGEPKKDSDIEFVLTLPQQITRAGDVHIRCYGRVLRVEQGNGAGNGRQGIAARIDRHEFLPPAT